MGENPVLVGVIFGLITVVALILWVTIFSRNRSLARHASQQSTPKKTAHTGQRSLVELASRLEVPVEFLEHHCSTYQEMQIPKRGGGKRYLQVPDEESKKLQRRILKRLLGALRSHSCCYGFEADTSIVDAAIPHTHRSVVIKMDVRRFFESTTDARIFDYFRFIGWDESTSTRLMELTTYNGYLPQGSPTSPRLSSLVNFGMDELLASIADAHEGSYSRYADDITMSFDGINGRRVRGIIQEVRRVLDKFGYTMHGKGKLKIYRRHQRQEVLGLVVNEGVALPRKTRRWLRAVQHRLNNRRSATLTAEQLDGWLAFQNMVERQQRSGD